MKKVISMLLAMTLLLGICGAMTASAAPAYFSFSVSGTELNAGQNFTVSLTGEGLSQMEGAQLYIYYDPTVFEVVRLVGQEYVGKNVLPGGWNADMAESKTPGRLLYMVFRDSATGNLPDSSTRMHNISFRVKADAPTCTTGLSMSLVKVVNSEAKDIEARATERVTLSVINPNKPAEVPEPGVVDGKDVYEAEEAMLEGGATVRNINDGSGGRLVGQIGNDGGSVTFMVETEVAGARKMDIYYNSADNRRFDIKVNNSADTLTAECPAKGSWNVEISVVTIDLELVAGVNTVTFDCFDAPAPNLDRIEIEHVRKMNKAEKCAYLIENLGEVTELSQKPAVDAARAAYDALTDEEKAQVSEETLKLLTDAEQVIEDLLGGVDMAAVEAVIAAIDALGEIVSLEQEAAVVAARQAYDALTDEQKVLVTNYAVLTAAEEAIADLKYIPGDVDMTGVVDVADIMKLKSLIMADKWTEEELTIGDLDGSKKLDVGDIMAVKNIIMAA